MSAEVRPDPPSTPEPGPSRKKKFKIAPLLTSLIVLLVLAYCANLIHRSFRNLKVASDFLAWTLQLSKDNPSVAFGGFKAETSADLFGSSYHHEGKYTTPTGRVIAIDFNNLDRTFGRSGGLVLSAEGRAITWPIEDIERGRKIDLKAEFPEAFR